MLKNIFLSTLRNFKRNGWLTTLNLTGLVIGLTAFLLLMQYVFWQRSFDQFHKEGNNIYRVDFLYYRNPGELTLHSGGTFGKVSPTMLQEFPEVEAAVRLHTKRNALIEIDGSFYEETDMFYADESLFEVFSYDILEGDPATCLMDIKSAVISEQTANKYFPQGNAIGKRINLSSPDGDESYEVTAVVRSPKNSHFRFRFIFPLKSLAALQDFDIDNNWNRYDLFTYVRLNPSADPTALQAKFPAYLDKYGNERLNSERIVFQLMPMTDIHLNSHLEYEIGENGNGEIVKFLFFIAIFILVIAWINYVNLSTAGSLRRAKEVGVRKTLGAMKGLLRLQFLIESLMINGLALMMALLAFWLLLPQLEQLINQSVENTFFYSIDFWLAILATWVFGASVSGFYPALVLSKFSPLKALKSDNGQSEGKISIRGALVTFQFLVSALLVAGTLIIVYQIKYMTSQDVGVAVDNRMGILVTNYMNENDRFQQVLRNYKEDILKINGVKQATVSSEVPGESIEWSGGSRRIKAGQTEYQYSLMFKTTMDTDFFDFYENQLLAGRPFQKLSDTIYTILNETGMRALDFRTPEEAINQEVYLAGLDTMRVLGVIKDFHQESLANPIPPTAYLLVDGSKRYVSVELDGIEYQKFTAQAQTMFENRFPNAPFIHFPIASHLRSKYAAEGALLQLVIIFSVLAIFIAILGLIGLAFFSIEKRKKEISIRKVLGSSGVSLFGLLTRGISAQVLIANIIATPVIYYFANNWLEGFAYRISFPWITLVLTIGMTLMISLSAVSSLIFKVLRENPVKYLRNE